VDNSHNAAAGAAALLAGFGFLWAVFVLGAIALGLIVNWRIASKAGYSGALSLLMLIPVVNAVIILIFAFSRWPIEQQRDALAAGPNLPAV
jgi:hypothetical protein